MNVILPERLQEFVRSRVESGEFRSVDEVLEQGVLLLQEKYEKDRDDSARLEELKSMVAAGIADADQGRLTSFNLEKIRERGQARLEAERAKG
ncbi:MAG: type II toxin-antitoxin system ParD family antitoxin [Candidatus Hydrogenedentes bacterium]|nr:type II toxin-antitoxin system ParD family antitoxin [Candidatus Hydrogenedentota bacterium]